MHPACEHFEAAEFAGSEFCLWLIPGDDLMIGESLDQVVNVSKAHGPFQCTTRTGKDRVQRFCGIPASVHRVTHRASFVRFTLCPGCTEGAEHGTDDGAIQATTSRACGESVASCLLSLPVSDGAGEGAEAADHGDDGDASGRGLAAEHPGGQRPERAPSCSSSRSAPRVMASIMLQEAVGVGGPDEAEWRQSGSRPRCASGALSVRSLFQPTKHGADARPRDTAGRTTGRPWLEEPDVGRAGRSATVQRCR